MKETGKLLTELAGFMQDTPQVLVNVRISKRGDLMKIAAVKKAVDLARKALGKSGRVLLRLSGTEPKARVMIEGESQAEIESLAGGIADAIKRHA